MDTSYSREDFVNIDQPKPSYRYLPLLEYGNIRVLRLEPAASFTAPLIATLFTRPIEDDLKSPSPRYACISYCWGISDTSSLLICDGHVLPITANVDDMLRHLRKATKVHNLWIDAICIDQNNYKEKASQVQCMNRIYLCADKVHIWLGSASPEDRIPAVFALVKAPFFRGCEYDDEMSALEFSFSSNADCLAVSLRAFLLRPWFTRRWVGEQEGRPTSNQR
jgi:hypothetical protein